MPGGETSQSERQSQQKNKDQYYNVQLTGLESLWATDIGLMKNSCFKQQYF